MLLRNNLWQDCSRLFLNTISKIINLILYCMIYKGVWKETILNNYIFSYNEQEFISAKINFFEDSIFKINEEYILFPSFKNIIDEKISIITNRGQKISLYDYWLGTGKVYIDNYVYEFNRETSYSFSCKNSDGKVIISLEELNPFHIEYELKWEKKIDSTYIYLFCISLIFYIKFKKTLF